jgi:hypothetical protein
LAEARRYARDVHHSTWDFAVEIGALESAGLTISDFRWLVCKGFVEHARDVTNPGDRGRDFRPDGDLIFCRRSCFVLTEAGAAFADMLIPSSAHSAWAGMSGSACGAVVTNLPASPELLPIAPNSAARLKPHWDAARRTLFFGEQIVKQYRAPCPNQEAILNAFQEEDWPPRIDDPLRPLDDHDSKRRLHDAIKSLNRCHIISGLMRFHGDGTGEGVFWEILR